MFAMRLCIYVNMVCMSTSICMSINCTMYICMYGNIRVSTLYNCVCVSARNLLPVGGRNKQRLVTLYDGNVSNLGTTPAMGNFSQYNRHKYLTSI